MTNWSVSATAIAASAATGGTTSSPTRLARLSRHAGWTTPSSSPSCTCCPRSRATASVDRSSSSPSSMRTLAPWCCRRTTESRRPGGSTGAAASRTRSAASAFLAAARSTPSWERTSELARIVVVGGGLGGLAVAARLARMRHDVVLVERSESGGGKRGELSRDGFRFDTGPSLVTLPATLRDLFLKTGRPLEEVLDLQPLEMLAHYRFPDGTELDLPNSGVNAIASSFQDAFGGRAGPNWTRFHERAERMWAMARTPFVESPLGGPATLVSLALRHPAGVWR